MKTSLIFSLKLFRRASLLCLCSLALSACSESSGTGFNTTGINSGSQVAANESASEVQPISDEQAPVSSSTTRVTFNITVPAYISDELQVRLTWRGVDTTAAWVEGVNWTVSENFPLNSEDLLVVTFSDRNGRITLATFENAFRTGSSASSSIQITADQFDAARWDNDEDGVSNLDELIAGGNPDGNASLQPAQASLELVRDKTFRISWEPVEGAQFYRVLENPDGASGYNQISADLDASQQAFDHRVALYLRVSARYIVQSCSVSGCSDSDELIVSGTLTDAIGVIQANNSEMSLDLFGTRVSISADGNTLAIGALGENSRATGVNGDEDDNSANDAGAAYVFERVNGNWQQQAYLKASNTDATDRFGESISLSADGETLAVGAVAEDSSATGVNGDQSDNSLIDSGAVYVFTRSNGVWQQQAYIKNSIADPEVGFGDELSLNADGNTLAVSVDRDRSVWSVNLYERSNGSWSLQDSVSASVPAITGRFARSLNLSSAGNTLAVGASDSSRAIGINGDNQPIFEEAGGAVYVFERVSGGWEQQAHIKASNAQTGDNFGSAVGLSENGATLAVGAPGERSASTGVNGDQNDNSLFNSGATYIFQRTNGAWQQQAYLKASSVVRNRFGTSVSLSGDSNTVAITAAGDGSTATGINGDPNDNSLEAAGAVYVFTRSNGQWQHQAYIKPPIAYDLGLFGGQGSNGGSSAISLSENGEALAIGTSAILRSEMPLDFRPVYLY